MLASLFSINAALSHLTNDDNLRMFGGRSEGFLKVQYQWETAPAMVTSPSAETMPILQRKMKMLYHCRARCRVRGPYLRRSL